MLKDYIWNVFENTGNINAYVFFKEIQDKNTLNSRLAEETPRQSETG